MLILSEFIKKLLELNQKPQFNAIFKVDDTAECGFLFPLLDVSKNTLNVKVLTGNQIDDLATLNFNTRRLSMLKTAPKIIEETLTTLSHQLVPNLKINTTMFEITFAEKFGSSYHTVEFAATKQKFDNGIINIIKHNLIFDKKFYYEHNHDYDQKVTQKQLNCLKTLAAHTDHELPTGIKTAWEANKMISLLKNELIKPTSRQISYIRYLANDPNHAVPATKKDADLIIKKLLICGTILISLLGTNVSVASASVYSFHATPRTHFTTTHHSYYHTTTRHYLEPKTGAKTGKTTTPEEDTKTNQFADDSHYNKRGSNTNASIRADHPWFWFFFGWLIGNHNNDHNRRTTANTHTTAYYPHATTPSEKLAESVLTSSIKTQLKTDKIKYNSYGAFIIDNNKSNLNADVTSSPYATNTLDSQKRAYDGEALLNRTTRQYQNRESTNNGASDWKPIGFIQRKNLGGKYSHAYDRGHLLGYALIGGLKGFDASESNAKNIATQTAWANEARDKNSTGQNYYECLVRKALDQNKTVRYSVKDLYENKNAKVPAGAWIKAKSKDGSVNFNVFVPNVQSGLKINYNTGVTTIAN